MLFRERAPDLRSNGFGIQRVERFAAHFTGDDDPLGSVDGDREGRRCVRRQCGVRALGGVLEILRVVIATRDDDEVFQAAGDEQVLAVDEAQIAGAQVIRGIAVERRAKGARRLVVALPVARADARAGQLDFADPAGRAPLAGIRIDDLHAMPGPRPPA
uniref:hypothetical protein n=1 Tax=Burkholderia vietnamiensis TaxID=60552 RepID=UPI003855D959